MLNTVASLGAKLVTILCAFVLPRLILKEYGSEVNGLVSSINQFLLVISLSEFGITAVVQSALYKPLAEGNQEEISKILSSSTKFFRRIAYLLIGYVLILSIIYPLMINNTFGFAYVVSLIFAMSISSLVQYLFGITNSQLISADQRSYILDVTGIVTNLTNTILCCILVYCHASIQTVKLISALTYTIQPLVYTIYVRKHYSINLKIKYTEEPIAQKWNGVAQHIAYYVLNATDIMVLTMFSTLENVSIYYVYHLVLNGLNQLFSIFENAAKSFLGEAYAINERERLNYYFSVYEWMMHELVTVVFGCTLVLFVPFVRVYTKGVDDANYIVPVFAAVITLAYAVKNYRNPYNVMIMSAGRYKSTQFNYISSAAINVAVSIISVIRFGLVGVAVGTLVAMLYQTMWQAWYVRTKIIGESMKKTIQLFIVDIIMLVLGIVLTKGFDLSDITYLAWGCMALKVGVTWFALAVIVNIFVYRNMIFETTRILHR